MSFRGVSSGELGILILAGVVAVVFIGILVGAAVGSVVPKRHGEAVSYVLRGGLMGALMMPVAMSLAILLWVFAFNLFLEIELDDFIKRAVSTVQRLDSAGRQASELENCTVEPETWVGPKKDSDRSKPHLNVISLGHIGHGKTLLTAAVDKVMADKHGGAFSSLESIQNPCEERVRGITIRIAHVEYESSKRHYAHIDCPSSEDCIKSLITGAAQADVAVLVVSSRKGLTAQAGKQLALARHTGLSRVIVFLDVAQNEPNPKSLQALEWETRALLDTQGFVGAETPVIVGSASRALVGDVGDLGIPSVERLLLAMDDYVSEPERDIDRPFLMPIEDVFSISGRGTVATGRVERGRIKMDDSIELIGFGDRIETSATGVEMFRKTLDEAVVGDNVGLLLAGVTREQLKRGQVLAQPGSITQHIRFECEVYMLSKEEGGLLTSFTDGYRPQFYFRTTDVTGSIQLPDGIETVMPGDSVKMTVELVAPMAIEEGLGFAVREGGRTVGAGLVSKIIK